MSEGLTFAWEAVKTQFSRGSDSNSGYWSVSARGRKR